MYISNQEKDELRSLACMLSDDKATREKAILIRGFQMGLEAAENIGAAAFCEADKVVDNPLTT